MGYHEPALLLLRSGIRKTDQETKIDLKLMFKMIIINNKQKRLLI